MKNPNLSYIKSISGGDSEFEEHILNVLKNDFFKEKKEFQELYDDKNFIESANLVHKIKHKFSILGLKDDFTIASEFEKQLQNKEVGLYNDFVNILDKIHVYLKTQ